ncbi:putative Yippee zinc binding DNA binding Mis18 centromere assembly [Trypanosoma vivax]|uniref:Protein yippee-like n=1 Tax=Trypanosoma vivax (strain Y486) TaxID=1055687 RepID=G0TXD7_TRYVY|nr:putative zinc-binding protein (Yippee) [Trypanosoma vivax]KAH8613813.1 putative Yippee zinc binding DNA binding Mis18 centromere assembly [Trypanosoma vivax]CCC48627.1 putative zinc-binding protein (Yippee) [Trypanosoma vivax Y486]
MVQRLRVQLLGEEGFGCGRCGAYLCNTNDVMSRHFHGKHGKAYLVSRCFNYYFGPPEEKELMTGTHIVRDVFCSTCDRYFGWTYDFAHQEKERYKVSRFVMERKLLTTISKQPQRQTVAADSP